MLLLIILVPLSKQVGNDIANIVQVFSIARCLIYY